MGTTCLYFEGSVLKPGMNLALKKKVTTGMLVLLHTRYTIPGTACHSSAPFVLKGTMLSRTYGTHKNLYIFPIFTENIWSC